MTPDPETVLTTGERGRRLPSLGPPLILLVLAVIGNVIIARSGVSQSVPSTLIIALGQILSAAMWVGAVWLGGILAYRGIVGARG